MARQRRSNVKSAQHQPIVVPTRDSTAPVITPAGGLSATPAASNVGIMPRVAVSPPSPSSASSDDEDVKDGRGAGTPSRPVSLTPDGSVPVAIDTEDTATCQWEDCGIVFTEMQKLVDHIHSEHIGVHKSSYTCEWASCLRRGLPQTSRFALISHIRSHTGEKPFTCTLPECDKSFTRSDALAKHMRLQHNISPPAPGRGGSRKRKRGLVDDAGSTPPTATPPGSVTGPTITIPPSGNFGTFKIEPNTPSELAAGGDEGNESDKEHTRGVDIGASASTASNARGKREKGEKANGRGKRGPPKPSPLTKNNHSAVLSSQPEDIDEEVQFARMNTTNHPREEDDDGYSSSNSDVLPSYLQSQLDETSGLIRGKTPAKVMYLLMKAKFEYAIKERENLLGELQKGKIEAKQEKDEKEGALDELLKRMLGPESEILMQMPGLPEGPPLLPPSSIPPTAHPHGSSIPPFSQSTYRPLPPPHSSNSHSHYRDAYVVAPGPSISNNDPYRQPPPPSFGMQNGSTRSHAHDRERRVSMSSTRGN